MMSIMATDGLIEDKGWMNMAKSEGSLASELLFVLSLLQESIRLAIQALIPGMSFITQLYPL